MFVQMISSESFNLLLPNLVWWCTIMSQVVFWKDWFAVFKVKVTVKDHIIKLWLSNISSDLLILLQLNLVWWYIVIRWIVLLKKGFALLWSRSRSHEKFMIPVNVHLDEIFSTAKPFVIKPDMVMHHHGSECHAKWLVFYLHKQGQKEGSYNQMWLFLPYLLNCWFFCYQM